jgi:transketolase N-terminal domain/subunit
MTLTIETGRRQKVAAAAYRMRHHVLNMGEAQGQGYVGQALGAADMLAGVYADQLRYRAEDPHWDGRDRFLLSTGHYAIGLYAALAEAGIIDVDELDSYGSDGSRLPMSGMASYTPGMEISGGSLGHGLTVAVGMALGLRHQGSSSRVINFLSDGELDEGSTWEAAMSASHHRLGNLTALVDINALQADGPHRRRAAHRTGHRQMGRLRLVRSPCRRQRRRRAASRLRRHRRPALPHRHTVGPALRHQGRVRGAAAGKPRKSALHAH